MYTLTEKKKGRERGREKKGLEGERVSNKIETVTAMTYTLLPVPEKQHTLATSL